MVHLGFLRHLETLSDVSLDPTNYIIPNSVQETLRLLKIYGKSAKILAGGITLHSMAKMGMIPDVKILIDLQNLHIDKIELSRRSIKIGSMVTLTELLESEVIEGEALGALRDAAMSVYPVQVRNVATVGGEVCSATPNFDLPPALLALDASIVIMRDSGRRVIKLDEFFASFLGKILDGGGILTAVQIPVRSRRFGSAFLKFGRTAYDYAVVNSAVGISLDKSHRIRSARVALGGVFSLSVPRRVKKIERFLEGKSSEAVLSDAALDDLLEIEPIPSVHASPSFKHGIAKILVRRAVAEAIKRAKRSET